MEASNDWLKEQVELNIFDEWVDAAILLTESGSIDVRLATPVELSKRPDIRNDVHDFEGKTSEDYPVLLKDTLITSTTTHIRFETAFLIKSISPAQAIINKAGDTPYIGENVTIKFDMSSFQPSMPMVGHFEEIPLLSRDDWTVYGYSIENFDQRIDHIKKHRTPIRTGIIEFEQQVNGPPERQYQYAKKRLVYIIELLSYLQGVRPAPICSRITQVNGEDLGDEVYMRYMSNSKNDIGHVFKGRRIIRGDDLRQFLDEAYDDYVDSLRDKYALNRVISWYLDGINATRTIGSCLASLANGIELFADRHSEHGPRLSEPKEKIRYLVDKLGVETEDLARYSGTFDENRIGEEDGYQEYFYYKSRQHVVHGEHLNAITSDKLLRDYEATLILLQRLLRNQLVGEDTEERYAQLGQLELERDQTNFL